MKQRKKQLNTNVFFGFLSFIALILFLISFLFDRAGRLLFLGAAFAVGGCIVLLDAKERKKQDAASSGNAYFYGGAALLTFLCVNPYTALFMLLLYGVVMSVREMASKIKIRVLDISGSILQANYRLYVNGERRFIHAKDIVQEDLIEILSGEIVPVDGIVVSGEATCSLKAIDGSTKTFLLHRGDVVISGTTLLTGALILRAQSAFKSGTVSRIVQDHKALSKTVTPHEKSIRRLVRLVGIIACGTGVLYALVTGFFTNDLQRVGITLIWVCLLCCTDGFCNVLHYAYVNAGMRCANNGMVAKNKKLIEKSIFIKNLLFRKQGVLTERKACVEKVVPVEGVSENELLTFAAYAQYKASHPMTYALNARVSLPIKEEQIRYFMETEDNGALVQLNNGVEIITGTSRILTEYGVDSGIISEEAVLCVAVNNKFIGHIVFEYPLKEDIHQYVDSLKYAGAKNLTILTRDSERATKAVALKSGFKRYICELDRAGIEEKVKEFGKNTVYIGYGMGDAYELGDECVKLMYGGYLYDNQTTDGILLSDGLSCILKFFNIIKDTRMLVLENLVFCVLQAILTTLFLLQGSQNLVLGAVLLFAAEGLCALNAWRNLRKI